jgi:hypothetical protein
LTRLRKETPKGEDKKGSQSEAKSHDSNCNKGNPEEPSHPFDSQQGVRWKKGATHKSRQKTSATEPSSRHSRAKLDIKHLLRSSSPHKLRLKQSFAKAQGGTGIMKKDWRTLETACPAAYAVVCIVVFLARI